MPNYDRLLRPRSIVIVGASEKSGSLGLSVLENLDRHRYDGAIHLVNPKRESIGGRPCLVTIDDLPAGVDVAVLAIPGPAILDALRSLAKRGVGAAVIFAAGFAEGGADGVAAQAEIAQIARDHDMVIEGPNCLGLVNHVDGVPLTFVEAPPLDVRGQAGVGIVSQSGAMAVVLGTTLIARELGISLSISTGNEAASGVEDYVEHLIDDPHTHVVAMIVEQFRQPARFLRIAGRARAAGKRIVLLHPGTSQAARESAATHTGAMAGDWQLMKVKVTRAGVVLAGDLEELGDMVDILARAAPLSTGGTAVLTESGAFKALTLDLAERIGLRLPTVSDATAAAIRAVVPDFIGVSNPMDLTAQTLVDPDLYRRTLALLLDDPAYAAIVLGIIQTDVATAKRKLAAIIAAVRELAPDKPVIFAGLDEGAPVPIDGIAALRAANVPYFPSADRAFRALARLSAAAHRDDEIADRDPIALDVDGGTVPEHLAKAYLRNAGIAFPAGDLAHSLAEAQRIAERVGFPVALKAQSAALSHKSDAGGVILNVAGAQELDVAWSRLHDSVARHSSGLTLDGVLVEAMAARGLELIIGARSHPEWGPTVLVGAGGVTAELYRDVRLIPHDLTRDAIIAEIERLQIAPLLRGFRGEPPRDIGAVADIVEIVSRVLAGSAHIREIDLNPVVVYPQGKGALALDALIFAD